MKIEGFPHGKPPKKRLPRSIVFFQAGRIDWPFEPKKLLKDWVSGQVETLYVEEPRGPATAHDSKMLMAIRTFCVMCCVRGGLTPISDIEVNLRNVRAPCLRQEIHEIWNLTRSSRAGGALT